MVKISDVHTGQLVLVSCRGYPSWPAFVVDPELVPNDDDEENDELDGGTKRPTSSSEDLAMNISKVVRKVSNTVPVIFINDSTYLYVRPYQLKILTPGMCSEFIAKYKPKVVGQTIQKQRLSKSMKENLVALLRAYELALEFPDMERCIQEFDSTETPELEDNSARTPVETKNVKESSSKKKSIKRKAVPKEAKRPLESINNILNSVEAKQPRSTALDTSKAPENRPQRPVYNPIEDSKLIASQQAQPTGRSHNDKISRTTIKIQELINAEPQQDSFLDPRPMRRHSLKPSLRNILNQTDDSFSSSSPEASLSVFSIEANTPSAEASVGVKTEKPREVAVFEVLRKSAAKNKIKKEAKEIVFKVVRKKPEKHLSPQYLDQLNSRVKGRPQEPKRAANTGLHPKYGNVDEQYYFYYDTSPGEEQYMFGPEDVDVYLEKMLNGPKDMPNHGPANAKEQALLLQELNNLRTENLIYIIDHYRGYFESPQTNQKVRNFENKIRLENRKILLNPSRLALVLAQLKDYKKTKLLNTHLTGKTKSSNKSHRALTSKSTLRDVSDYLQLDEVVVEEMEHIVKQVLKFLNITLYGRVLANDESKTNTWIRKHPVVKARLIGCIKRILWDTFQLDGHSVGVIIKRVARVTGHYFNYYYSRNYESGRGMQNVDVSPDYFWSIIAPTSDIAPLNNSSPKYYFNSFVPEIQNPRPKSTTPVSKHPKRLPKKLTSRGILPKPPQFNQLGSGRVIKKPKTRRKTHRKDMKEKLI